MTTGHYVHTDKLNHNNIVNLTIYIVPFKSLGLVRLKVCESILCSLRLHLFDQKTVKYYHNLNSYEFTVILL